MFEKKERSFFVWLRTPLVQYAFASTSKGLEIKATSSSAGFEEFRLLRKFNLVICWVFKDLKSLRALNVSSNTLGSS